MHRILYLDFDGVLHPAFCPPAERFQRAKLLAECIGSADCEIVISSSWRFHYPLQELKALLPKPLRERIKQCTGGALLSRYARHREILAHVGLREQRIDWRALDDSVYEFPRACKELIACNGALGIEAPQLDAVQKWLVP